MKDKNIKIIITLLAITVIALLIYSLFLSSLISQTKEEIYGEMGDWACEENLKLEATELREAIALVARGDVNSKKYVNVEMKGSCAEGIYLKHLDNNCKSFCPNHPNACWTIIATSRASEDDIIYNHCIDISGGIQIESSIFDTWNGDNPWLDESTILHQTTRLTITKTGPATIEITKTE